jgi:polyisoprenoid-binding protein YceI
VTGPSRWSSDNPARAAAWLSPCDTVRDNHHRMALSPGNHTAGPDGGSCRVHTYREGMAQKVGHDLIIEVGQWQASVEVGADGEPKSISLEADPTSLRVLEGHRGVKPLTDSDRAEIRSNIAKKILGTQPIKFSSTSVQVAGDKLIVEGDLTMAGSTKPASFELALTGEGGISGTLPVTQSEWGIKPYRAFMGALKVRDTVEVVLDASLPST